jgi:hypothetical protein
LVDFADGMAAPADSHADRLATIALGQARATLAVAEEIRALREMFGLTGRGGTVGDQLVIAISNVEGLISEAAVEFRNNIGRR